jgi:signal peptidase I
MKGLKVFLVLFVPFLALTLFVVVSTGVVPYKVYVVHTGSMMPTIPSRSAVVVRENQYHIGEPVSFYLNGSVVTHRLVGINPDGTIDTKGDANATVDPWHVAKSAIIGGVVAAPAELGYWLMYVKNPAGLASIMISVLACWQIWSFVGEDARNKDVQKDTQKKEARRTGITASAAAS